MKKDLIRLTTGTRYAYFSSLYNEESPIYQKLGQQGKDALANIMSSVRSEMKIDITDNKITNALYSPFKYTLNFF